MSGSRTLFLVLFALALGTCGGNAVPLQATAPAVPAPQASVPQERRTPTEWTAFTRAADARVVHVSSSGGSDGNDGTESAPVRTIAAGKKLLRDGYPDWLLLKRGDSWKEPLGTWGLSGRSKAEPMLVSSYGADGGRPLLRTGTSSGFDALDKSRNDHLALVGLHFWADGYTGREGNPRGVQLFGSVEDFLIEDCCIQAYDTNLVVQGTPEGVGRHKDIRIRRNVIVDAYTLGTSNTAGIFASSTDGLLVEENLLDHNGWRDDVPGSTPNWFRRNVYIQNGNTGVVFRGNIVAGTDGVQMRSGGLAEDNLFLRNAIALELGGGTNPEVQGVSGTVRRNVILDGRDLEAQNKRGWGLWLMNLTSATIEANVIAHNVNGHGPYAVTFGVSNGWSGNVRGVENTTFSGNVIYAWNGCTRFLGSAAQTVQVRLVDNRFQEDATRDPLIAHDDEESVGGVTSTNNTFHAGRSEGSWMKVGSEATSFSAWKKRVNDTTSTAKEVSFPDPERDIGKYNASIGGPPTLEAFLSEARKQSKSSWRAQYTAESVNAYIRAGFGL